MEKWKQYVESSNKRYYFVSDMGNVKSISKVNKKKKPVKGSTTSTGYLAVMISRKIIKIHKMVAYCFIGERPEKLQIDHIDRNKLNNRLDNLRYCTAKENQRNKDCYRIDILTQDQKERDKIIRKEGQKKAFAFKIKCPCGSITDKINKNRHEKSKKHLNYLKNFL
jgi:hypothetical protein